MKRAWAWFWVSAWAGFMAVCAAASALAQGAPMVAVAALDHGLRARALADNVYVVEGANADFSVANGCNIINTGFITTGAGVIVVNTGPSRRYGEQLRALIAKTTGQPILQVIHLNLPPLNEERRRDLVKQVHHRLEEARIAVRNIRRDAHNDLRDFEKEKLISEDDLERGETELQKITDRYVEEIGEHGKKKEVEIMEV